MKVQVTSLKRRDRADLRQCHVDNDKIHRKPQTGTTLSNASTIKVMMDNHTQPPSQRVSRILLSKMKTFCKEHGN